MSQITPRPARPFPALGLILILFGLSAGAGAVTDIRVLVDTSGSMKTTDPGNLRIPALKLLAELLPVGSRAGVWLFDENVAVLLPVGKIDTAWKQRARAGAAKIHSRGLFTNIEAGIAAASRDWGPPEAGSERHLVLLTDGKVDVAKDASLSAASRTRMLGEQLAGLKSRGVKVHTIALSADVDTTLLEALASGTGGWREDAPTAAALQRAFLHIFEQAAAPDTLPLTGNRFVVDASISEVTLLVFHKPGAPPLALTDPSGKTMGPDNASESLRWQQDVGYDLVTLHAPAPGNWSFSGDTDPDNRALVVTNLSLETGELPAHLVQGQDVLLSAHLLDQGKPIERDDFLELVTVGGAFAGKDNTGDMVELPLHKDSHRFVASDAPKLGPGAYELTIRARSNTFEREKRWHLEVLGEPLGFKLETHEEAKAGKPSLVLDWQAEADLIDPASASGYVLIDGPDGYRDVHDLAAGGHALSPLTMEVTASGEYHVSARIFVNDRSGRLIKLKLAPQVASLKGPTKAPPPPAELPPALAPPAARVEVLPTLLYMGLGNLALAALLGPLWYVLRRRGLPSKGVSL